MTIVFSGPHWHRVHHSTLPEHRDRNFAAFFPAIDRLFGTYYRPASDEFPPTGLIGEAQPLEVGVARAPAPELVNA